MAPGFDPDLFAKSSFFLLLLSSLFWRNNQRIYRSYLLGILNKKGLTDKPFSFDVSIISGDMFVHLSQNLPLVRKPQRASKQENLFGTGVGVSGVEAEFWWEKITQDKGTGNPLQAEEFIQGKAEK